MADLSYITLYVQESLFNFVREWYVQNLSLVMTWESDSFVLLSGEQGARLGLHVGTPLSEPGKVQLHFQVADVDALHRWLSQQGMPFLHGSQDQPWGYRTAALRDPVGHHIELFTAEK